MRVEEEGFLEEHIPEWECNYLVTSISLEHLIP